MRALALSLLLLSMACKKPGASAPAGSPTAPSPPGTAPATPAEGWKASEEACVDRWLQAKGLDAYGFPRGTMYSGGTPLFDEASGQRMSRREFLLKHQPDAMHDCTP
jgi:hypothetical protein